MLDKIEILWWLTYRVARFSFGQTRTNFVSTKTSIKQLLFEIQIESTIFCNTISFYVVQINSIFANWDFSYIILSINTKYMAAVNGKLQHQKCSYKGRGR